MWCILIFGLGLFIYGISMIVTKKGLRVLSKAHEEVTGGEAVAQGVIAIIIGLLIFWFWYEGTFR